MPTALPVVIELLSGVLIAGRHIIRLAKRDQIMQHTHQEVGLACSLTLFSVAVFCPCQSPLMK